MSLKPYASLTAAVGVSLILGAGIALPAAAQETGDMAAAQSSEQASSPSASPSPTSAATPERALATETLSLNPGYFSAENARTTVSAAGFEPGEPLTLQVLDVNGEAVQTVAMGAAAQDGSFSGPFTFNINLPAGMYEIRLTGASHTASTHGEWGLLGDETPSPAPTPADESPSASPAPTPSEDTSSSASTPTEETPSPASTPQSPSSVPGVEAPVRGDGAVERGRAGSGDDAGVRPVSDAARTLADTGGAGLVGVIVAGAALAGGVVMLRRR